MNTVTVVIKGLCLWLTTASIIEQMGGLPAIIPDFSASTPAHVAMVVVAKTGFVGEECPEEFTEEEGNCIFNLNGAGFAGGVKISFDSDQELGAPDAECALCAVPPIQHSVPFTLKSEYSLPSGADLAAQLVMDRGSARSTWSEECASTTGDCPRFVEWTVSATEGYVQLVLSNLQTETPIEASLKNGANVLVSNETAAMNAAAHTASATTSKPPARTGRRTRSLLTTAEDWCLYFGLFTGGPTCPGEPPIPSPCGSCARAAKSRSGTTTVTGRNTKGKAPAKATKKAPASGTSKKIVSYIQTIACSNSQYP
ncbi:MAG: hypothetical protein ABI779_01160 [Acidobacteriota bacterium]